MNVLALNSGSSTLKFGLYRVDPSHASRAEKLFADTISNPDLETAIAHIAQRFRDSQMPAPAAIGHRIVHGGPTLRQHCRIDDAVIKQLESATAFAPLHMPQSLSLIRFAREHFPDVAQVACFDTTFHAELPDVARVLPIPKELQSEGIQRYGFHGLSCESIMRQLGGDAPERIVIAHLGNGASVTAVKAGKSIDTSMGLTPTGGVVMSTRSGEIDPGVLLYLLREKKFDVAALEYLIEHRSGLLGISGVSSDMRRLHEAAAENAGARLAIQMFCYAVRKYVVAMGAALGGVDMLVFTGGIGENDARVRAQICDGLAWVGISLDAARNESSRDPISASSSRCTVRVLPSQEEEQIARHTAAFCADDGSWCANVGAS